MAYPNGVALAVLTLGAAGDFFGGDAVVSAKVTPVLGGTSHLVHRATGDVLVPTSMDFVSDAGGVLSVSVPIVDQPGWVDASGRDYTGWSYRVVVTVQIPGSRGVSWEVYVSPVTGQTLVDLDMVPVGGKPGSPTVGEVPKIVSVVGKTGAVTAADLIAAGVGGTPAWEDVTGKPAAFPSTTALIPGLDTKLNQLTTDLGRAGAVKSVNGQVGDVVVDSTNVLSVSGYLRPRGKLAAGTDLDTIKSPDGIGIWELTANTNYVNGPPFTRAGHLIVTGAGTSTLQRAAVLGYPEVWERTNNTSTVFNPWAGVNVIQPVTGLDLDALRSNGEYVIRSHTDAAAVVAGWPEGLPRYAARVSVRTTTTNICFQQMQTYGAEPKLLVRSTMATSGSPYPFSPWVDLTPPTEGQIRTIATEVAANGPVAVHAGTANALLLQDFTRRRPVIKTGGKPVVALRFDHGLTNFDSMIVPHLKRLGLPAAICLNAGDWSRTENTGVTKEMVNDWVAEGWLEIWNHSFNHTPPPADPVALEQQIKGGLDQLRLDLPAATIDGYMPPGGSGDTTGFNGGRTPEAWWDTAPGRMILQYHAVASGYLNRTQYRTLDGEVRQGQLHYTVDTMALDDAKSKVTGAYDPVRGVQMMIHPSLLDTSGNISAADAVAFLEWIAAERDAGRVMVLGPYDQLRADARA